MKSIKNITGMLLSHLLTQAASPDEPNLRGALQAISVSPDRLRYYVEGTVLHLMTSPGPLTGAYTRSFVLKMMPDELRWAFQDYKKDLVLLLKGEIEIDLDVLTSLIKDWSEEECDKILDVLDLFIAEPETTDFNWQIVGKNRISVELVDSSEVFVLPLSILDYLQKFKITKEVK